MRAADAPRAASSIKRSSTKCSCTGGTKGWMIKTSRSRQLAWSCTPRQSFAYRSICDGSSGTPRWEQISAAKSGCALPLKTAISVNDRNLKGIAPQATTNRRTTLNRGSPPGHNTGPRAARKRQTQTIVGGMATHPLQVGGGGGPRTHLNRLPGGGKWIRGLRASSILRGDRELNPVSSNGESATNCTGGGLRWSPAAIHAPHY